MRFLVILAIIISLAGCIAKQEPAKVELAPHKVKAFQK